MAVPTKEKDLIEIIILSGATQPGMRVFGSKAAYPIWDNDILINYQIQLIKECYPNSHIILILGFNADKITKTIFDNEFRDDIRIVENQLYDKTNNAEELRLALNNCQSNQVVFFPGEILFNKFALINLTKQSSLIYENKNMLSEDEIGITLENHTAVHLAYGLQNKWSGIGSLIGNELELCRSLLFNKSRRNWYIFEVINAVIGKRAKFRCIKPTGLKLFKINSRADIQKIQELKT